MVIGLMTPSKWLDILLLRHPRISICQAPPPSPAGGGLVVSARSPSPAAQGIARLCSGPRERPGPSRLPGWAGATSQNATPFFGYYRAEAAAVSAIASGSQHSTIRALAR